MNFALIIYFFTSFSLHIIFLHWDCYYETFMHIYLYSHLFLSLNSSAQNCVMMIKKNVISAALVFLHQSFYTIYSTFGERRMCCCSLHAFVLCEDLSFDLYRQTNRQQFTETDKSSQLPWTHLVFLLNVPPSFHILSNFPENKCMNKWTPKFYVLGLSPLNPLPPRTDFPKHPQNH